MTADAVKTATTIADAVKTATTIADAVKTAAPMTVAAILVTIRANTTSTDADATVI